MRRHLAGLIAVDDVDAAVGHAWRESLPHFPESAHRIAHKPMEPRHGQNSSNGWLIGSGGDDDDRTTLVLMARTASRGASPAVKGSVEWRARRSEVADERPARVRSAVAGDATPRRTIGALPLARRRCWRFSAAPATGRWRPCRRVAARASGAGRAPSSMSGLADGVG